MKNKLETALDRLVEICQDKKVEHVVSYKLNDASWITDYVLLVTVKNTVHCKALAEELGLKTPELAALSPKDFYERPHMTGNAASGWIVVDLNSIIVHCVTEDMRAYYKLDVFFEKHGVAFHY